MPAPSTPAGNSPFVSDVPADAALELWLSACAAAGCPDRLDTVRLPLAEAVGRVTAAPVWATRSSPVGDAAAMDGIAVLARDTAGATPTTPLVLSC